MYCYRTNEFSHICSVNKVRLFTFSKIVSYRSVLVGLLVLLSFQLSVGQNINNFTQFFFNPAMLNPSLTGVEGRPAMFVSYRKQWVGVQGSPSIGNFSLQAPLPNRVNIGLNLTTDKEGLINTSSVAFMGGYTLPISLTQSFRFGFSVGLASRQLDYDALDDAFKASGDKLLADLTKSNFGPVGNIGFSFHGTTFHGGLSIPNLFRPIYLTSNTFGITEFKPLESLVAHISNRFYYNKGKLVFEPYLVYRYNKSLPSQVEVAGVFHLNNVLYLGASYKQNYGISGLGGFRVNKTMKVGFSYSLQNIGTNTLSNPSFELHLGLLFGKKHAKIPVYSFVDTELEKRPKKTALELANEKRKVKSNIATPIVAKNAPRYKSTSSDTIAAVIKAPPVKKQPVVVAKKTEPKVIAPVKKTEVVKTSPPTKKPEPVVTKTTVPPIPTTSSTLDDVIAHKQHQLNKGDTTGKATAKITPTQHFKLDSASQHEEEQDRLKRLELHADNATEQHGEEGHPHAERHEFAKRGDHHAEMDLGDYVIAGVFNSEANAKKYSDGLRKLGFNNSDYGYLSVHNHWYVHISESNDINTARADRDKYRKMKIFKESWLLTVHP